MRELTGAQAAVVRYVAEREAHGDLPPTHREMCRAFGITPNAVKDRVRGCERKGYIKTEDLLSRGIRLTSKARSWLGPPVPSAAIRAEIRGSARRLVKSIGATIDGAAAEELVFVALLHERIAGAMAGPALASVGRGRL